MTCSRWVSLIRTREDTSMVVGWGREVTRRCLASRRRAVGLLGGWAAGCGREWGVPAWVLHGCARLLHAPPHPPCATSSWSAAPPPGHAGAHVLCACCVGLHQQQQQQQPAAARSLTPWA